MDNSTLAVGLLISVTVLIIAVLLLGGRRHAKPTDPPTIDAPAFSPTRTTPVESTPTENSAIEDSTPAALVRRRPSAESPTEESPTEEWPTEELPKQRREAAAAPTCTDAPPPLPSRRPHPRATAKATERGLSAGRDPAQIRRNMAGFQSAIARGRRDVAESQARESADSGSVE